MGTVIAFKRQEEQIFERNPGKMDPLLVAALKTDSLSLCLRWLRVEHPQVFNTEVIEHLLAEIKKYKSE
ncbi:MAG: hypothetical protein AAGU11_09980 [Syntrophobacteraceae bacterium]